MSSSRLPGKVLKNINGRPMIEWQVLRIQQSRVDEIILATSDDKSDDDLADFIGGLGVQVFRGSLNDVHSRFLTIVKSNKPDYFIRLTGDCPVVMPNLINEMIAEFETHDFDYLSNINPPTFPDGLDIELISGETFLEISRRELSTEEKEHVTLGIRRRRDQFKIGNFEGEHDFSRMRWTVDYEEDFEFIRNVFAFFVGRETSFTMDDILHGLEIKAFQDNLIPHEFRNISLDKGVYRE
jgi:spore coat polysaccharide biosynthesis protein SpsF (cytidylyltransferase family)